MPNAPAPALDFPRLAKLSAPDVSQLLARPQLLEKMATAGPVIWLCAPPGSGKTSAAAAFLASHPTPGIWYHLDRGDEDPATFFRYLAQAVNRPDLPQYGPEYGLDPGAFARRYFRELFAALPPGSHLVLDDYHDVAEDSPLHHLIKEGLEELPHGLGVTVTSRSLPPAPFSRLRAQGRITVLGNPWLQWTPAECAALARARGQEEGPQGDLGERLYGRTQGWVTGLLLELAGAGEALPGQSPAADSDSAPGLLFDYFMEEVFRKLDLRLQHLLVSGALLPAMTASTLAALSPEPDIPGLLTGLLARHLFISRQGGAGNQEGVLVLHPLFRHFLLALGPRVLGRETYARQQARAAQLLMELGEEEEALSLLATLADWSSLRSRLYEWAPRLLEAGQHATLHRWLSSLPAPWTENEPWYDYYLASCVQIANPKAGREIHARAYRGFLAAGEDVPGRDMGAYLAWAGACATFLMTFTNMAEVDAWIATLGELRQRFPAFPGEDVEAAVLGHALNLPPMRGLPVPDAEAISQRLETLLPGVRHPLLQAIATSNLIMYHLWGRGDITRGQRILDTLDPLRLATQQPLARISWECSRALQAWLIGDHAACDDANRIARKMADDSGLRVLDFFIALQSCFHPAWQGNLAQVHQILDALLPILPYARAFDAYQYHLVRAATADAEGQLTPLQDAARETAYWGTQTDVLTTAVYGALTQAWAHSQANDLDAADESLAEALIRAPGCGSAIAHWDTLFTAAVVALDKHPDDAPRTQAALEQFFHLGARLGLINAYGPGWHRPRLARLCAAAIARNIEPDYVHTLIRRHQLLPPATARSENAWPWPVRIHTLGRFTVYVGDEPLSFQASRVPVKPFELLKALIAQGGREVPQDLLADALWPESEGDAGRRAFYTNLHRLRSLLGDDALNIQEGRVTLNPLHCWTDLGCLNTLAREPADAWTETDRQWARQHWPQLKDAPFLPHDDHLPWIGHARRRILRQLEPLGKALSVCQTE